MVLKLNVVLCRVKVQCLLTAIIVQFFFCSLKIDYFVLQYEGFQLGKTFSGTESMTSGSKF